MEQEKSSKIYHLKLNQKRYLGIAGISGSGKSSIINIVTKLVSPSSGSILFLKKKI